MSHKYKAVEWNSQKRTYDVILIVGIALFLFTFAYVTKTFYPRVSDEILVIRATGILAYTMLHIVICIGPVARINRKLLPLLYNRRHFGVATFLIASVHATMVVLYYHSGGETNPILSIFTSSPFTHELAWIPFQPFGAFAWVILLVMAATSHDFWLANLTAPVWKALHMLVYIAYASLVIHVFFGVLQSEQSPALLTLAGLGVSTVIGLHWIAGSREVAGDKRQDRKYPRSEEGFAEVCTVDEIPEKGAKIVCLSGERIAIFKYDGFVSAVSNVCQHQNGPLGEGRIIDGCITCPWHGYQYYPHSGRSPEPFREEIPTFDVRIDGKMVLVYPKPNLPGTETPPARIPGGY